MMIQCFILLFCLSLTELVWGLDRYEFDQPEDADRYHRLVEVLRCPKCLNVNLAGSDAPIANDLRKQVYLMIKEGRNDEQILAFMQLRYGDFILYQPRFRPDTWLLWFAPLLMLIPGFFLLGRKLIYSRRPK